MIRFIGEEGVQGSEEMEQMEHDVVVAGAFADTGGDTPYIVW
jgi:hypothetical protein